MFPAAVSPPDQGWRCGARVGGVMSPKLAEQMPFSWTSEWLLGYSGDLSLHFLSFGREWEKPGS